MHAFLRAARHDHPTLSIVMTVIASVIRRYRLTMPAGFKPEPISRLTIRPRTGMKLLFGRVG